MLSPSEFTIGSFGSAPPLSLILPRTQYEAAAIIGDVEGAAAAVFLSGPFVFRFFETAGNHHWHGLIVPKVRIEVDEATLFDPDRDGIPLGAVIRSDTRLVIHAKAEHSFGQSTAIALHNGLPSAGALRAAFAAWQVVIGVGRDRRVLWQTPTPDQEAR